MAPNELLAGVALFAATSVSFLDSSAITSMDALYIVRIPFYTFLHLDCNKLVDGFDTPILDSFHSK
jgi:hypothetical protein